MLVVIPRSLIVHGQKPEKFFTHGIPLHMPKVVSMKRTQQQTVGQNFHDSVFISAELPIYFPPLATPNIVASDSLM